jgi:hypothetical protein
MCRGTMRVEAFVYPRPAAWQGVWPPSVVETRAERRSCERRQELLEPATPELRAA